MAAGTSAPELFSAVADSFITDNGVGIGTIVGSSMYNLMCICGAAALYAYEPLHLDWYPILRDSVFYVVSIVVLLVTFLDQRITIIEASIYLLCYAVYVVYMKFNA